jgi:hypothetical protein
VISLPRFFILQCVLFGAEVNACFALQARNLNHIQPVFLFFANCLSFLCYFVSAHPSKL